jgi:hypothetical protein
MAHVRYHGRRAASLENDAVRITVLEGGGHIAEVLDKKTGVNPLWMPPWPSIEPGAYDPDDHPAYGSGADASLLAGIMGHNLCLDIFGGPSADEAKAGLPAHGETSTAAFEIQRTDDQLVLSATLPLSGLFVERELVLVDAGRAGGGLIRVRERVDNMGATDRPVGWTQHVTLGPPFLQPGQTELRVSATQSRVYEGTFGPADYLAAGADFNWPDAPLAGGGTTDLRLVDARKPASGYTAHLMDPRHEHASFLAYTPALGLAFGYVWRRADFPWMGMWDEHHSRSQPPWNGAVLTRGMEFGVSPFPESRREMIERGQLFETPVFRWIPAGARVAVEYWIVTRPAAAVPETLGWPGQ